MTARDARPRRRDAEATRHLILRAARRRFATDGYTATTVKGVADDAGVSPNLITRYFGGKNGLFLAASTPQIATDDVFVDGIDGLGERLARSIVERWTGQVGADPLLVLQRASGEHPEAADALDRFLDENSLAPLQEYLRSCGLDEDQAADRAGAIDALILGVSARRRILRTKLEDVTELERWLAETIQRLASLG